jgi:hypothetical protein
MSCLFGAVAGATQGRRSRVFLEKVALKQGIARAAL